MNTKVIIPWALLIGLVTFLGVRKLLWHFRDRPASPNYALVLDSLYNAKFEPIDSGDNVALGTSITQMLAFHEYNLRVRNRGIPSNTIPMMTGRLPGILAGRPDTLLIEAGINDIFNGRTYQQVIADYDNMINTVRDLSPGIHLLLQTLPPVYNHNDSAKFNIAIDSLNAWIEQVPAKVSLVDIIDMQTVITRDMVTDDVHLNRKGYRAWAAVVGAIFEKQFSIR